jgi:hypothetical protein
LFFSFVTLFPARRARVFQQEDRPFVGFMMICSKLALSILALIVPIVLSQEDESSKVPSGASNILYPPYTYVPSVFGDWKPHPYGAPFPFRNGSVNPWNPFPQGPQPPHPPGLPPHNPGQPASYWYEDIEHNGLSPFATNATGWKVYRNVKDYGATGDGTTDDSLAM